MKKQIKSLAQLEVAIHNAKHSKWSEYRSLNLQSAKAKRAWLVDALIELKVDPATIGVIVEI